MVFAGLNYLAVILAAITGFAFSGLWYGALFQSRWREIVGVEAFRPKPSVMITTFVAQGFLAWMLAGLIGHLGGEVTIRSAMISAAFVWVGFVITTMIVNHRFAGLPWSRTAIDGGYWLCVLLVMGLIIGALGI